MLQKALKHLFATCLLLLVFTPILQSVFKLYEELPLKGAFVQKENIKFNLKQWNSGEYQSSKRDYLNENFGLRTNFVRLNNQVRYSLFNKLASPDIYMGKNEFFYRFTNAFHNFSSYYNGTSFYKEKVRKLEAITEELKKHGTTIIFAIPPSKSYYHYRKLPDLNQIGRTSDSSNYNCLTELLKSSKANWIDLNKYFLLKKAKLSYPLFAKGGFHWCTLGSYEGMREIMNYASKIDDGPKVNVAWNNVRPYISPVDIDISETLNLLFPPSEFDLQIADLILPNDNTSKPNALVISDSFFDAPFWGGIGKYFSDDFRYWYYNNTSNDLSYNQNPVDKTDTFNQTKNRDYIIIINSILNLTNMGWGIIDELYETYCVENNKN